MAGIPESSFDQWALKFLEKGYRIARVDQSETLISKRTRESANCEPKNNIIKRELKCVLTSGTITSPSMATTEHFNFIMSISKVNSDTYTYALLEFSLNILIQDDNNHSDSLKKILTIIKRHFPREIIVDFNDKNVLTLINSISPQSFIVKYTKSFNIKTEKKSIDLLQSYISSLKQEFSLNDFRSYDSFFNSHQSYLNLDYNCLIDLHILQTGHKKNSSECHSLQDILDNCYTSAGSRVLKEWIMKPLLDKDKIFSRQQFIKFLHENPNIKDLFVGHFKGLPDLERILSCICNNRSNLSQIISLLNGLSILNVFCDIIYRYSLKN